MGQGTSPYGAHEYRQIFGVNLLTKAMIQCKGDDVVFLRSEELGTSREQIGMFQRLQGNMQRCSENKAFDFLYLIISVRIIIKGC